MEKNLLLSLTSTFSYLTFFWIMPPSLPMEVLLQLTTMTYLCFWLVMPCALHTRNSKKKISPSLPIFSFVWAQTSMSIWLFEAYCDNDWTDCKEMRHFFPLTYACYLAPIWFLGQLKESKNQVGFISPPWPFIFQKQATLQSGFPQSIHTF